MGRHRRVRQVLTRVPTMEGAGVRVKRVFGAADEALDPFLLLDEMGSSDPDEYMAGFPWHPHRGIETVTYMLAGAVEHADSLGNRGVIRAGDVQWMTAGSGIVHQEMPQLVPGGMRGFQLWVNLPASHKMMEPRYREVPAATIATVGAAAGVRVAVVAGEVEGVTGPVEDVIADPTFLDVTVDAGTVFDHPVPPGHTVLAYVISGDGMLEAGNARLLAEGQLAVLTDGDAVLATAGRSGLRFLLLAGKPLREPVAWWGPIVMNTQEELRAAFREFDAGTFVKVGRTGR